jgi:amino acid transporter
MASSANASTAPKRLGRPVLTTWDAIAQSMALGPVFKAVFITTLVAGVTRVTAPLSILLAAAGMFCVSWVITLYARRYVGTGSVYDYLRPFSPALALFTGCLYFTGILILGATGVYAISGLLSSTLLHDTLGIILPWWIIAVLMALVVFVFNSLGIKLTTRIQLILSIFSLFPFLLLATIIIIKGGAAGNTFAPFNPTETSLPMLFQGTLYSIVLFLGFEAATSLGEESLHPERSIPKALLSSLFIATISYLVITYASEIGFGVTHLDVWLTDSAPFDTLAHRYIGNWIAVLLSIAVISGIIVSACAFTVSVSRGLFALARHGFLPSFLAHTRSFRSFPPAPAGSNLFVLICALLVIALLVLAELDPFLELGIILSWSAILIAIPFLYKKPVRWWRWPLLLAALVTPLLALYGNFFPFPYWPASIAPFGALLTCVGASIWTLLLRFRRPDLLQRANQPYPWEAASLEKEEMPSLPPALQVKRVDQAC